MYKYLVYHAHSIREKKEEIQLCKMQQNKVERERKWAMQEQKKNQENNESKKKKRFFNIKNKINVCCTTYTFLSNAH